jgi:hypothetical protein
MNQNEETSVQCPQCQSNQIHASKRGWNIWLGFIGSGAIVITCLKCGHRFKPGKVGSGGDLVQNGTDRTDGTDGTNKKPGKLYEGIDGSDGEIPTYKL